MNDLLQFIADCWLPLLLAGAAGLALYHLGRSAGRREARDLQRARREARIQSMFLRI